MGSPVELPCPISERATRMRTLLSGLTTIQAVSSGSLPFAAAWPKTVGTQSSIARPPPTVVDTLRKSRRDLRNGIVMIGPIDSALRPVLLQYALCSGQFVIPEVLPQLGLEELPRRGVRSEEHTSELQSPCNLVCRLLLEKKKKIVQTLLAY